MVVFPNCKINLGLNVVRKRADGYHDLETVFYPLPVKDVLEVINREPGNLDGPSGTIHGVEFSTTGLLITGEQTANLCLKAYQLLKNDFPNLPPIKLHLHKAIPMGAGLGGGSSDGAFTLTLLNEKFRLGLSVSTLLGYALQLGSDCPFFIVNKPCFATGRGEMMEELEIDLAAYSFVLVNPGIHIPTGWAFSELDVEGTTHDLKVRPPLRDVMPQPLNTWKNALTNDFEKPVFQRYPAIRSIKDQLYQKGALFASMSGSGSTVFGIFEKNFKPRLEFPGSYGVICVEGGKV